jgi:hypothetical protein
MNYLSKFSSDIPLEILDNESYLKLSKMLFLFKDFVSRDYGLETCLYNDEQQVDFAFCVRTMEREFLAQAFKELHFQPLAGDKAWDRVINFVNSWSAKNTATNANVENIWLEMDSEQYEKDIPCPCIFFDASQVTNNSNINNDWLFDQALKKLLDNDLVELLQNEVKAVIKCLPPGTGLFQVGIMLARNEDMVRICTSQLTMEQTVKYLNDIRWPGDLSKFDEIFDLMNRFVNGKYIVNFSVTQEGVPEKIGIEFRLKNSKILPCFLKELAEYNLCTDLKREGLLSWKGSSCQYLGRDYGQTSLLRNIAHFKAGYSSNEGIRVKAYLRIIGVYLKELFKKRG